MNIQALFELSQTFITHKFAQYRRYFIRTTLLKHHFAIILGERGIGKTTTIIQYLLDYAHQNRYSDEILYIQADHFVVQNLSLYEIAETFVQLGGQFIAFDELHKYPNWSMELKSICDTFPQLRIIASGSSALEIHQGSHDLSRRAVTYRMVGLSFREFIELSHDLSLPSFTLTDILQQHTQHAFEIIELLASKELKILKLFQQYRQHGYYPYFREFKDLNEFKITLEQNLHTTIEADLAAIYPHLTGNSIKKIKQLLAYIAQEVPFTPNWQKIKNLTDIQDDRTIKTYFKYLEDASIVRCLPAGNQRLKHLEMTDKILLSNPNLLYTLETQPNIGNVRETFFLSMLSPQHKITGHPRTDFCIDNEIQIEVGGKNKDLSQVKELENAYLAVDNIEHGFQKRIPLWLFGFLY